MNKVKAFTLTELIVVMMISTIVISLAYTALSMVKRQIGHIQQRTVLKEQLLGLEKVLHRDFNRYGIAEFSNSTLKFKNPIDSTIYTIDDHWILRNKDTFDVSVTEVSLFLNGHNVKKGNVDALKLTTKNLNNRATFIYTLKDAAFYLND